MNPTRDNDDIQSHRQEESKFNSNIIANGETDSVLSKEHFNGKSMQKMYTKS